MNILFFASDNNKTSGAFISLTRLCALLKKQYRYNVYVVLPKEGEGQELLSANDIPFYIVRSFNWTEKVGVKHNLKYWVTRKAKTVLNKIALLRSRRLIQMLAIDIVHINTTWTYIGAQAALQSCKPYVWHIREFLEEDQNVTMWNNEYGYDLMARANSLVAISDSIYNKYTRLISSKNLVRIYNGIDETRFYDCDHQILQAEQVRLVIVGSVSEKKGQQELVEACKILKEYFGRSCFHLDIVGIGQELYINELKRLVYHYGLVKFITFWGYQSQTEEYYKNGDIIFVCSKAEAFGRVTVEAMLGGSLVVGANTAATLELISDMKTGILYESGNARDLAEKMNWILDNRAQAQKIANQGREYMYVNMTANINAKAINDLYIRLCD